MNSNRWIVFMKTLGIALNAGWASAGSRANQILLLVCLFSPMFSLGALESPSEVDRTKPNLVLIFTVIVLNPDDNQPLAPHSTIREGDWKVVFDWSGALKLYDLANDPFEQHELSAQMPDKTQSMFRKLNDWLDANVKQKYLPALNPDYDASKEARSRPFVDLRRQYLGQKRAIRSVTSDPRFELLKQF